MQGGKTSGSVFILLKDKVQAEKTTRVMGLSVPRQLHTSSCCVLKGELVTPIPTSEQFPRSDGQKVHNYHTLTRDSQATFYDADSELNVAPLSPDEYDVLAAIKSPHVRFNVFIEEGKLDWGTKLKIGDMVTVELPVLGDAAPNKAAPRSLAKIRYVGPVRTLPGITFGVEIKDKSYFGWGSTNGYFQGDQYFKCPDDRGLFVSLDKLYPSDLPYSGTQTTPSPPSAQQQYPQPTPRNKGRKNIDMSSHYRYKIDDRVVFFSKKDVPIHGTVKWVGMYGLKDHSISAVGIETDVKIKNNETQSLPKKDHYFQAAKDKSAIFLSESEVLPEADFAERPPPALDEPVKDAMLHDALHEGRGQHSNHSNNSSIDREAAELAKAMGVRRTEMMQQNKALLEETKQRKQQQEIDQIKQAVPDQSLSNQEHILQQISQQRHHVKDQISGNRRGSEGGGYIERGKGLGESGLGGVEERWKEEYGGTGGGMSKDNFEHKKEDPLYDLVGDSNHGVNIPPVRPPRNSLPSQQATQHDLEQLPQGHNQQLKNVNASHGYPNESSQRSLTNEAYRGGLNQQPPFQSQQVSHAQPAQQSPSQQPRQRHMAYDGHQGTTPSTNLEKGSAVQIANNANKTGVIRWIGNLPGVQGLIAGVELDEPMEGCTDGEWNGLRFFTCPYGRGIYCPLVNLRADTRLSVGHSTTNPLDVPDWESIDQPVPPEQFMKYIGDQRGIQGHQNSCYLDATIFGLFALSDVFDNLFLRDSTTSLQSLSPLTPAKQVQRDIGSMLWKGIVNPLRKNGAVRFESVMKLRNKLEELGKMEGVNTSEKDPEEFLNMLFKHTLHVDPFIQIKRPYGTEPEFFVQLFTEFDESLKIPTIETLLEKMFKEQKISFTEVPSKLLVQVPRYGKQFQTYKRIIPGLKFDPNPLIDNPTSLADKCFLCEGQAHYKCNKCKSYFHTGNDAVYFCDTCNGLVHKHKERVGHTPEKIHGTDELDLLSVLCIETSHYVCFSRDSEGRWVFFDSMANRVFDQYNIPRGIDCTAQLNDWIYEGDQERLMTAGHRELPELVRRFTQDVYMCVYIQPDYGMYK